jgi:copper homeostasis protein (lipoprotein)
MRRGLFGLLAVFVLLCGARASAASAPPFALPATFAGTTPCAGCPGTRTTLTLGADGKYVADLHYLVRDVPDVVYKGSWSFDSATSRIELKSPYGAPQYFVVADPRTLRILDRSGNEIKTTANENLSLMTLDGNTWVLTELRGQHLSKSATPPAPTLTFDATGNHVSGSTGCNRLAGTYTQTGSLLKFSALAMTRMACADSATVEAAFIKALEQVQSFNFERGMLNLYGGGFPLARFKATPKS